MDKDVVGKICQAIPRWPHSVRGILKVFQQRAPLILEVSPGLRVGRLRVRQTHRPSLQGLPDNARHVIQRVLSTRSWSSMALCVVASNIYQALRPPHHTTHVYPSFLELKGTL